MQLKFLLEKNSFSDVHTSAYFITDQRELVLIDLSLLNLAKLLKLKLSAFSSFTIFLTHTHSANISGLPLLANYIHATFVKTLRIVAPSEEVKKDIISLLKIQGCDLSTVKIITANDVKNNWFGKAIPTTHSSELSEKCFGYQFNIDDKKVIYTGHTITLDPFIPVLTKNTEFYINTSMRENANDYLKLRNIYNKLKHVSVKDGLKVYAIQEDNVLDFFI